MPGGWQSLDVTSPSSLTLHITPHENKMKDEQQNVLLSFAEMTDN